MILHYSSLFQYFFSIYYDPYIKIFLLYWCAVILPFHVSWLDNAFVFYSNFSFDEKKKNE